ERDAAPRVRVGDGVERGAPVLRVAVADERERARRLVGVGAERADLDRLPRDVRARSVGRDRRRLRRGHHRVAQPRVVARVHRVARRGAEAAHLRHGRVGGFARRGGRCEQRQRRRERPGERDPPPVAPGGSHRAHHRCRRGACAYPAALPEPMLFPTVQFAVFFPIVLILSWALMSRPRLWKPFITFASYVFYAAASWKFCFLLGGITLGNQAAAKLIART